MPSVVVGDPFMEAQALGLAGWVGTAGPNFIQSGVAPEAGGRYVGRSTETGKTAAGSVAEDDTESCLLDYKALIREQRRELEELKRAAREASPSTSSTNSDGFSRRRSHGGGVGVNGTVHSDGGGDGDRVDPVDRSLALLVDGGGQSEAMSPSVVHQPPPPQHKANERGSEDDGREERLANDFVGGAATTNASPCDRNLSGIVPTGTSFHDASPMLRRLMGQGSRTATRHDTRAGDVFPGDLTAKNAAHVWHDKELARAPWHSAGKEITRTPSKGRDGLYVGREGGARGAGRKKHAGKERVVRGEEAWTALEGGTAEAVGDVPRLRNVADVSSTVQRETRKGAEASWWAVDVSYAERRQPDCETGTDRKSSQSAASHKAPKHYRRATTATTTESSSTAAVRSSQEGSEGTGARSAVHQRAFGGFRGTGSERYDDKLALAEAARVLERSDLGASRRDGVGGNCDTGIARERGRSGGGDSARAMNHLDAHRRRSFETVPRAAGDFSRSLARPWPSHYSTACPATDADNSDYRHPACPRRVENSTTGENSEVGGELQRAPGVAVGLGTGVSAAGGAWAGGAEGGKERRTGSTVEAPNPSWEGRLSVKREEQSVLIMQLERELASTVSALVEERRQRRAETEVFGAKLEETRAIVRERESELDRRELMTKTIMSELETLQSRCDRLSASREEKAEEAEKSMGRLREDNRELEARVRQAEAAATEARAGRDDACAERDSLSRDLLSAKTMASTAERRAERAEASMSTATGSAQALQKTLKKSEEECEGLRRELEGLRKRLEEEGRGEVVASLRGKVADLERELAAANQRCVALEARLDLLGEELIEAEGGDARVAKKCGSERDGLRSEQVDARAWVRRFLGGRHGESAIVQKYDKRARGGRGAVERGFGRGGPTRAVDACEVEEDSRDENLANGCGRRGVRNSVDGLGVGDARRKESGCGGGNDGGRAYADGNRGIAGAEAGVVGMYEELNWSTRSAKPPTFPPDERDFETAGRVLSEGPSESSPPGSAKDRGVRTRSCPDHAILSLEDLQKPERAGGGGMEGQANLGVESIRFEGRARQECCRRKVVTGIGPVVRAEDRANGPVPSGSVLAREPVRVELQHWRGNHDYSGRAPAEVVEVTGIIGSEGRVRMKGTALNGEVSSEGFWGAADDTATRKDTSLGDSRGSSPPAEFGDRARTPAPAAKGLPTFNPEDDRVSVKDENRLQEMNRDKRRGVWSGVLHEEIPVPLIRDVFYPVIYDSSGGGDGTKPSDGRTRRTCSRRVQVDVPTPRAAQAQAQGPAQAPARRRTAGTVGDKSTVSSKAQRKSIAPRRRRAGAISTGASAGRDRAKNALYHSSTRRRSVPPSSSAARVIVPSYASASTRGQRRSGSVPPDASSRQQRNQRKTRALPASGAWHGRTGRGGAHAFDERGVLERGRRSGGVSIGAPQRDRGKTEPGNLRTAATRAGEREILFRGGVSTNSINSKGGGLNMDAIGTRRRANVAPAANAGGVFGGSVERESVSLMRKRREREGTGSSFASSRTGRSSGPSGRDAAGVQTGLEAGVAGGVRAWRP